MKPSWGLLLIAWVIAVAATAGALFIGEVMGMTPCLLCWYQRICMFPMAIVLGIACYSEDRRGAIYALPLAMGGIALAGYHTLLVAGLIPKAWIPCTAGVSCADPPITTDTDGDGTPDCADNCPNVAGQLGSTCDDGNALTINEIRSA